VLDVVVTYSNSDNVVQYNFKEPRFFNYCLDLNALQHLIRFTGEITYILRPVTKSDNLPILWWFEEKART